MAAWDTIFYQNILNYFIHYAKEIALNHPVQLPLDGYHKYNVCTTDKEP